MGENKLNCEICFEDKYLVGFSSCNHPICAECCLKLCIFNEQATCPKCRQIYSNVIFDKFSNKIYDDYKIEKLLCLKLSRLMAANKDILDSIVSILSYNCKFCHKSCANEDELTEHLETSHELFLCEFCIKNLNFLPKDFYYYSKRDLILHMNCEKAGHPYCEICNIRFFNADKLITHKRKDHVTCPLCLDLYFSNVSLLKAHARQHHFLCELGKCSDENLVNIFLNDPELRNHRILYHFAELNRTDYNYIELSTKHEESNNSRKKGVDSHTVEGHIMPSLDDHEAFPSLIVGDSRSKSVKTANLQPKKKLITTPSEQYDLNFPSLVKKSSPPSPSPSPPPPPPLTSLKLQLKYIPVAKVPLTHVKPSNNHAEDFPSLVSKKYVSSHQKIKNQKSPIKIKTKDSPPPKRITLLDRLRNVCENYQPKIDNFLVLSGKYHQKMITATSYIKGGNNILGRANMDKLFPYLVESLEGDLRENLIETTKNKKNYIYLDI